MIFAQESSLLSTAAGMRVSTLLEHSPAAQSHVLLPPRGKWLLPSKGKRTDFICRNKLRLGNNTCSYNKNQHPTARSLETIDPLQEDEQKGPAASSKGKTELISLGFKEQVELTTTS